MDKNNRNEYKVVATNDNELVHSISDTETVTIIETDEFCTMTELVPIGG